jgi:hypothetical protein
VRLLLLLTHHPYRLYLPQKEWFADLHYNVQVKEEEVPFAA